MTDLWSALEFSGAPDFTPSDVDAPPPNGGGGPITLTIPDDIAPEPTGPTCDVCGVEIEWLGRGRKPKYCIDHRQRTRTPRAQNIQPPSDDVDKARLQTINDDLVQGAGEFAGTLSPFAPVTAVTVGLQSPDAIAALVKIGAKYPRFLDGLETVSKVVPMATVAKFLGAIMLAIMVDMERVKPYGVAAEMLGVARAAQEAGYVDPDMRATVAQQYVASVDKSMPPPPQFRGF